MYTHIIITIYLSLSLSLSLALSLSLSLSLSFSFSRAQRREKRGTSNTGALYYTATTLPKQMRTWEVWSNHFTWCAVPQVFR